ncbi:MAG TPA: hypothetical protein VLB44_24440 [Kofleriaceae bacterium]|nr:hypothetical protein [Kofleriaceae bacterium]
MELARGTLADRRWALTLATFARRGTSGQITLVGADQKRYSIALDQGSIVAARSPMSADGVARVALTSRLVTPEHVAELARRHHVAPIRDEAEMLADIARLTPPQLQHLRIDVTIRRAARTFAVEAGQYILEDKACLPVCGSDVDVRAVVYQGIRRHMTDQRLSDELRQLGGTIFVLEPHAGSELHRFGFGEAEWPLLAALRDACTLPELEARLRDMDPRTMQAAIYALVACGTARVLSAGRTPTHTSLRAPTPPSFNRAAPPPNIARTLSPMAERTPMLPSIARTKTNPELAAEAAERAARALEHDRPEDAVVELKKAVALVPNDVDYTALLGWALFCAADDKRSIAPIARRALESAVHASERPHVAQFYLGRIERILGRHREALGHFQAVLTAQPDHRDASAEVRVIEARMRREQSN